MIPDEGCGREKPPGRQEAAPGASAFWDYLLLRLRLPTSIWMVMVRSLPESEAAAGVTGAVIAADGGFSITKEPGGKPPLPTQG